MHRRKMLLALGAAAAAVSSGAAIGRAQSRPVLKVGLGPQQPTQADTMTRLGAGLQNGVRSGRLRSRSDGRQ